MSRAIVSVATGRYVKGLDRLTEWCAANGEDYITWRDKLPPGSPSHQEIPYGFKAFALKAAATASRVTDAELGSGASENAGASTLLWCDASIIPIRPLAPLWERIERDGYWIANNGWSNYEWTADSAYQDLFGQDHRHLSPYDSHCFKSDHALNRTIKHVVAGCFGLSMAHPLGKAIFEEYYRLASTTKAFCGPWRNTNYVENGMTHGGARPQAGPCGPADVRGHRHDQTALSVIAWRLGCELTDCPYILAYGNTRDGKPIDPGTIVLMDGIC